MYGSLGIKYLLLFNKSRKNPTKPGHFSRTLSKGPNTTTWIWNLHADAHDFDVHTSDLEEISRKVFSAHFGQLGVIFIWLSGCDFEIKINNGFSLLLFCIHRLFAA